VQGFAAILAAVCDLPRTCQRCDEQSAIKLIRKKAPTPCVAVHGEIGSNGEGHTKDGLKGMVSMSTVFGEAPQPGLTTTLLV